MVRTMSGRREFDTRGSIQPGLSMEDQFRAMNREMQTECLPTPLPFDLEFDTPEAAIGRALSADLERVASSISNDNEAGLLSIELFSNDSSLGDAHIRVPEGQLVYDAIQAAFPSLRADETMKRLMVFMGDEEMEMNSSFAENGIDDGARLEVCTTGCCPCL